MATAKQIAANQKNAALSTGPRSEEGKQRSRMNALQHGLSARDLATGRKLGSASPEELEERLKAIELVQLAVLEQIGRSTANAQT